MKKNEPRSTSSLISNLSDKLAPTRSPDSSGVFFAKWFAVSAVVVAFWIAIIPTPLNFAAKIQQPWFIANTLLWFLATAASALLVYQSRKPGQSVIFPRYLASMIVSLLLVVLAVRLSTSDLQTQFSGEMDFYRGRCGPLILLMGGTWALAMFWWTRKGAPTKLSQTGFWIGISTGCLASLAMQVICAHENPLHLLIWHVLPVALLAGIAMVGGRRWLRW